VNSAFTQSRLNLHGSVTECPCKLKYFQTDRIRKRGRDRKLETQGAGRAPRTGTCVIRGYWLAGTTQVAVLLILPIAQVPEQHSEGALQPTPICRQLRPEFWQAPLIHEA